MARSAGVVLIKRLMFLLVPTPEPRRGEFGRFDFMCKAAGGTLAIFQAEHRKLLEMMDKLAKDYMALFAAADLDGQSSFLKEVF